MKGGAWLSAGVVSGAVGVFALLPSSALAGAKVTLSTVKGPLAAGAELSASSSNLIFVTSVGNVECTNNVLEGRASSNAMAKDKTEVIRASSTGSVTTSDGEHLCRTTSPLFKSTTVTWGHFPWAAQLTNKGAIDVKGTGKILYTVAVPEDTTCAYEAAKLAGSFSPGAAGSPKPVEITLESQRFKLNKKISGNICPKEGKMDGSFELTSEGEAVDSEL